jgi:uncharacterized protein YdgA (DUF945 family)
LGYTCTKPALAVIETTVSPTASATGEMQNIVKKLLRRASVLNRTVINFSMGGDSTFTVNSFRDTFGKNNENSVTWKGIDSHLSFSRNFKKIKGTVKLPAVHVQTPEGSFTMGNIRFSFDLHKLAENFYPGTSSFAMDLFEIFNARTEKQQRFQMKKLIVNLSNQESSNTMSSCNTVDVAAIVVDDTIVGPIHYALELSNLDVPSMIKLSNSFRDLQKTVGHAPVADMNNVLVRSYLDVLPDLLKASPRMELKDLKVKTDKGIISGKLSIVCDGTKIDTNLNPLTIVSALSANLEYSMTSDLLLDLLTFTKKEKLMKTREQSVSTDQIEEQARAASKQQIDSLLAQNILVQTNGTLRMKARYENGIILINDQPIPLFNLLQQLKPKNMALRQSNKIS